MKHRRRSKFPLSATQGESTFFTSDDHGELLDYIKDTLNLDILPEPTEDFTGLKLSVCYEDEKGVVAVLPIEWPLPIKWQLNSARLEHKRELRLWTSKKIIITIMLFEDEHVADDSDVDLLMVDIPEDVAKVCDAWRRQYAPSYRKFLQRMVKEMKAIGVEPPAFGSTTAF